MRLLIVKMSSFGDVVHTFPALTDLKAARPDVEVDWLVEEGFAGLAAAHPAVSTVHAVALRRLRWPPTRWPSLLAHRAGLKHTLHARRYDMVVDLQGLVKSALMASLAGRPVTGIDPASAREPASARFYARKIRLVDHPHAVERLRHLLADAVGYAVPAGKGRAGILVPDVPLLVPAEYGLVVPSTSWPGKLWAEDRWRKLIIEIAGGDRKIIIPWGDEREEERARHLSAGLAGAEALSRRLNGPELMRLVGGARFAVGVDTGLMQLAAAFGVPGVTLFGPTDPAKTAPYGDNQRIVRSTGAFAPCLQEECTHGPGNERCIDGVGYEAVRETVDAMLAGLPATAASA
jgi:heptosyltransferase-1